ncbi:MAG TPA: RpiB/LacA/LacB family sugar-phosphate isomerase [bacterium]|jgi:ribose 5-phosphate isomerase B|nr:RpiB/LacA/LacB family sugar-phosphate isomerase [bacterium]
MLYIASDHGGYSLKKHILNYLVSKNIKIEDLGAYELIPEDDYPVYTKKLAESIKNNNDKGILICRNGVGVCMYANRFSNIRAGLSWSTKHAASSRNDDDTNILCLPADYLNEKEAVEIVETWLNTPFGNKDRYIRRLEMLNLK